MMMMIIMMMVVMVVVVRRRRMTVTMTMMMITTGPCPHLTTNFLWWQRQGSVGHSLVPLVSTKTECDYLNGWIKKRSHTQESHPKMVYPRDLARERRRSSPRSTVLFPQSCSHSLVPTVLFLLFPQSCSVVLFPQSCSHSLVPTVLFLLFPQSCSSCSQSCSVVLFPQSCSSCSHSLVPLVPTVLFLLFPVLFRSLVPTVLLLLFRSLVPTVLFLLFPQSCSSCSHSLVPTVLFPQSCSSFSHSLVSLVPLVLKSCFSCSTVVFLLFHSLLMVSAKKTKLK